MNRFMRTWQSMPALMFALLCCAALLSASALADGAVEGELGQSCSDELTTDEGSPLDASEETSAAAEAVDGASEEPSIASGFCGAEGDGSNLTWALYADGRLAIDGAGKMKDYAALGASLTDAPWDAQKDLIFSVTISPNVTCIGNNSFYFCKNLASISIPSSVVYIGSYAFSHCSGLTEVSLPSGVTALGAYAFYGCSRLASVTLSSSLAALNMYVFADCCSLTSITIPSSVAAIDWYAFYGCSSLENVLIPSSVAEIGSYAFSECGSLEEVTIQSGVTTIEPYAFSSCGSLKSITIPSSVAVVGMGAFSDCGDLANAAIRSGVTTIDSYAFSGCSSLKTVTIPASVTTIGSHAFSDCGSLENVSIPSSVTTIDSNAFSACSKLTSITIPSGVKKLGECAFLNCGSLESVTFLPNVTAIGASAFSGCGGLQSVTIPSSVGRVDYRAFYGCSNLRKVYYYGTEQEWKNTTIAEYNAPLADAQIVYCSGSICAFSDVSSVQSWAGDAIQWAVEQEVTQGTGNERFSPKTNVTRAQFVTFLWRMAGKPEASSASNPFSDVSPGAYYYDAVLWAVEREITAGMSATAFHPNGDVTRQQAVTFLWRYAGKPSSAYSLSAYDDSDELSAWAEEAFRWAVENKIMLGTTTDTISPGMTATRAQAVVFLHRLDSSKGFDNEIPA